MGLLSIFRRVERSAPDTDFSDLTTEFCMYRHGEPPTECDIPIEEISDDE